jgi:hypothetical protein
MCLGEGAHDCVLHKILRLDVITGQESREGAQMRKVGKYIGTELGTTRHVTDA